MKLCLHDWEIVEEKYSYQIEENIIAKMDRRPPSKFPPSLLWGTEVCVKKVCLKCEKIVDQIADYKKEVVSEYTRKQERQELAKSLIKKKITKIKEGINYARTR